MKHVFSGLFALVSVFLASETKARTPIDQAVIGQSYQHGRLILIRNGFKPLSQINVKNRSCKTATDYEASVCHDFPETQACGQGGEAPCRFEWLDPKGKHLYFVTHRILPRILIIQGFSYNDATEPS